MQKPIFMNRRSFSKIQKTVLCRRKSIETMHIMNKLHEVSVSSDPCMHIAHSDGGLYACAICINMKMSK